MYKFISQCTLYVFPPISSICIYQYSLFSSRLTPSSWSWLLSGIGLLMHGDRSLFKNLEIIGIFVTRLAAWASKRCIFEGVRAYLLVSTAISVSMDSLSALSSCAGTMSAIVIASWWEWQYLMICYHSMSSFALGKCFWCYLCVSWCPALLITRISWAFTTLSFSARCFSISTSLSPP